MDDLNAQNQKFLKEAQQKYYIQQVKKNRQALNIFGASLLGYSTYYIIRKGHFPIIGYAGIAMGAFALYINDPLKIITNMHFKL